MKKLSSKTGFSMAEALLALAITGFVIAMTVPSLYKKNQDRQVVTTLQQTYTILTTAYKAAMDLNGPPTYWRLGTTSDYASSEKFYQKIKPYLSVKKECGNDSGCFAKSVIYYSMDGITGYRYDTPSLTITSKVRLSNNVSVAFGMMDPTCATNKGYLSVSKNLCAYAVVDVNADKGPNKWGSDVFGFYFGKKGIIPRGLRNSYTSENFSYDCQDKATDKGYSCAAWVLENENRDYLYCKYPSECTKLDWTQYKSLESMR